MYDARKNFVRLYKLFPPNDNQKNDKIIHKYFKNKYAKKTHNDWYYTEKIDETRHYLSEEIKHNDLINEK